MEAKKKYSSEYLEKCSYRSLQQIAKSMCLPCNFKKIYLKELILAKDVKTEKELKERINYLKLERKNQFPRRKTTSENSYFKDTDTRGMLSPPITCTPKRTYIPRRSSPRFKNLFIRYKPKILNRRSTSPPKTYSSPKLNNEKVRVLTTNKNDLNDEGSKTCDKNKSEKNNVTPKSIMKEYKHKNVTISKTIPPENSRSINEISNSQGSHSNEGHIKNVSDMREALQNSCVKIDEEYPTEIKYKAYNEDNEDSSGLNENLTELMDSNNNIDSLPQTPPNIKAETKIENDIAIVKEHDINKNNSLPKFADAFANICSLPWVAQMQTKNEYQEQEEIYANNSQESIPDQFGFQDSFTNIGENYSAAELLESYLDSPEEIDSSTNISALVDQLLGQNNDYIQDIQNIMEDLQTVQCVICSRAGTKDVLEGHIKEKHSSRIHKDCGGEWALKFNLGNLTCLQIWCSEVLEHDSVLYLLSVKYQDPDYCMVTIAKLSPNPTIQKFGSITLYNSLTGEPHTWKGFIQPFSTTLPYYNENRGLKVKLEKLNLLPNSANLKLINRELVNSSLSKVIVGQPVLKNLHLMVFVRIL